MSRCRPSRGEAPRRPARAAIQFAFNTAADKLLSALLKRGLVKSDTPQGKVRFGLPLHTLRFYFPARWPEAEADREGA